jgi:hypothetical protein
VPYKYSILLYANIRERKGIFVQCLIFILFSSRSIFHSLDHSLFKGRSCEQRFYTLSISHIMLSWLFCHLNSWEIFLGELFRKFNGILEKFWNFLKNFLKLFWLFSSALF